MRGAGGKCLSQGLLMIGDSTLAPADWRKALSASDRSALAEAGWLHIRAAADERALGAMREAWARRMEAPPVTPRGNNDGPEGLGQEPAFRLCLEHPCADGRGRRRSSAGDIVSARLPRPGPAAGRRPGKASTWFRRAGPARSATDRQRLLAAGRHGRVERRHPARSGSHRLARLPSRAWRSATCPGPGDFRAGRGRDRVQRPPVAR